jgi:hypothetical protein
VVQETVHAALDAWEPFYIIVGSSAAALTGLQFVVITLITEARTSANSGTIGAFATPTIVHFCIALLVSATLSAPWPSLFGAAVVVGVCGVVGLVYALVIVRRATHQTNYTMVLEDWLWHVTFPLASYAALFVGAIILRRDTTASLFAVAAATLFLVYIGIHNAWDSTTYVAALPKNPTVGQATTPPFEPAPDSSAAPPTAAAATAGADNR